MEVKDPTQLQSETELRQVEREYKREVAIIQSRPILNKLFFVVWAMFDLALVALFLFVVGGYLVAGQFMDRREVSSMANNIVSIRDFSVENSASSLLIGDVSVFSLGDGEYDFFTTIENTNEYWYAEFDYVFASDSVSTKTAHGFVMPRQITPLAIFRQDISSTSGMELMITDLQWHRVDPHQVNDVSVWLNDHDNFTVTDATYSRAVKVDDTQIPRSSFTVTNNTSYNYWSAVFYVVLDRNGAIVGVNQVSIPGFEVGETRNVNVNWFGEAVSSADVSVYPFINYFDEDEYMQQPSNDVDVDRRDIKN